MLGCCSVAVFVSARRSKVVAACLCEGCGFGQIANTHMSWICAGLILAERRLEEVEEGRVVGKGRSAGAK